MTESDKADAVREILSIYVETCRTGDVERLKSIFHPQAAMNGYLAGSLLLGDAAPFFEAVAGNPAPADSGTSYETEIKNIVVDGNMATGTLVERGFLGMNFINHFQLLALDGEWKIVAKLFESS